MDPLLPTLSLQKFALQGGKDVWLALAGFICSPNNPVCSLLLVLTTGMEDSKEWNRDGQRAFA